MGITRDLLNILENGSTTSTYKFGLLRSITDYVFEHPREPGQLGFQLMPLFWIAVRFLRYYWYLEAAGAPQIGRNTEAGISSIIVRAEQSVPLLALQNPLSFEQWLEEIWDPDYTLSESEVSLLIEVRSLLIKNPITYIRNVAGQEITSISLVAGSREGSQVFDFSAEYAEQIRRAGRGMAYLKQERPSLDRLIDSEFAFILVSNADYLEMAASRVLLRDAINLRWFHLCQKFIQNRPDSKYVEDLTSTYPFTDVEVSREPQRIRHYRDLFARHGLNRCLYSGAELEQRNLHVDHLLPFSFFPRNDFWNLFPSSASVNARKSNRLPDLTESLRDRIRIHLQQVIQTEDHLVMAEAQRLLRRIRHDTPPRREDWVPIIMNHIQNQQADLQGIVPGSLWTFREAS